LKGRLRDTEGITPNNKYLPVSQFDSCSRVNRSMRCFMAGEPRVNENLGLVGLHTLFMREHNRIAEQLQLINPTWNDERLYFETRKIVLGIYQNIVFGEWLPAVIGRNMVSHFGLSPLPTDSYYTGYSNYVYKFAFFSNFKLIRYLSREFLR
jgi:peroxidase